jgi:hypothetical protein
MRHYSNWFGGVIGGRGRTPRIGHLDQPTGVRAPAGRYQPNPVVWRPNMATVEIRGDVGLLSEWWVVTLAVAHEAKDLFGCSAHRFLGRGHQCQLVRFLPWCALAFARFRALRTRLTCL